MTSIIHLLMRTIQREFHPTEDPTFSLPGVGLCGLLVHTLTRPSHCSSTPHHLWTKVRWTGIERRRRRYFWKLFHYFKNPNWIRTVLSAPQNHRHHRALIQYSSLLTQLHVVVSNLGNLFEVRLSLHCFIGLINNNTNTRIAWVDSILMELEHILLLLLLAGHMWNEWRAK